MIILYDIAYRYYLILNKFVYFIHRSLSNYMNNVNGKCLYKVSYQNILYYFL